ncbi:MAG: Geranylgeranyl diphosphate synthase [uncultured Acidimicrobiales bacterium]|uniref:Geranylgeranyl diphosphate synthase n=1 Tax=uncultured Acidimicrobiales bacterium TaxID=310071 RepID=A0A6J4I0K0_9ACTN|nr:MAG: Geranylgeranyl diphosphate synthase [uncultured Acidimicrobiales bacterium]
MRVVPGIAIAPPSLSRIADRVETRVAGVLDGELQRWSAVDPDLAEPLAALRDLVLAGGKRLRPAFCHWAYVGAGGGPEDAAVIDAGAALELLHTFALVHDDIMDGSATRRGTDTIHVQFEAEHALDGWRGEARRFGEGVAILVGDLAFVYADHLLAGAPPAAHQVFTELRLEVNVGQYLDLLGTARGRVTECTARRISRFKSGKYTVERPLHLGAALAGRLDDLAAPLSGYGLPLGEAFQLRDDLLGVFGDADVTGKPVGEDLREGKPTLLFAMAVEQASGADAAVLARYGAPDLDEDDVAALQDVLLTSGAVETVEGNIDRLVAEAVQALDNAALEEAARQALVELAYYVAGRDR